MHDKWQKYQLFYYQSWSQTFNKKEIFNAYGGGERKKVFFSQIFLFFVFASSGLPERVDRIHSFSVGRFLLALVRLNLKSIFCFLERIMVCFHTRFIASKTQNAFSAQTKSQHCPLSLNQPSEVTISAKITLQKSHM